ncbi:MAG TPA: phosphatase PAP2 family protein, partial [Salinimicrobium sp.]|nr:phosphatase PAP2 family protein [Salinimicrobium sp.]
RLLLEKIWRFTRRHISRKNENLPFYILIFLSFVVFVLGINFFVELTDDLSSLKSFDNKVFDFFISFRNPQLTEFFVIITDIGDFYGYLVATCLVTIFLFIKFRHWKFILQLLAVVILSALSNIMLKKFIDRARPGIEHLVVVETLSYPSGHAMSAMAFYGFLTYLSFHIKMSRILRVFLCTIFVSLILLIGISRIYLGVHFPTDVIGGFIAGLIWVFFCIFLFNIFSLYRKLKGKRSMEEEEENFEE